MQQQQQQLQRHTIMMYSRIIDFVEGMCLQLIRAETRVHHADRCILPLHPLGKEQP